MRKLFIMLVCFTVWSGSVAAKSLPIRIYVQDVDGKSAWVIDGFAVNERKRRRQVYVKKDKITGQQVLLSDNIYTEKSKTLHNNWGWNGSYNGWFPEGCFDSHNASKRSSTITRGTDGNYQYNRKIYINLRH